MGTVDKASSALCSRGNTDTVEEKNFIDILETYQDDHESEDDSYFSILKEEIEHFTYYLKFLMFQKNCAVSQVTRKMAAFLN